MNDRVERVASADLVAKDDASITTLAFQVLHSVGTAIRQCLPFAISL